MCLLVIRKILRLFLNTLSGDDKYSLLNRDNVTQPIQMQLSKNKKNFLNFFLHFWNLVSMLYIFKEKMTLIADVFLRLWSPKNVFKSMSKKSHFSLPFEKQHGKRVQTLLKS